MSRITGAYDLGRATGICAASGQPLEPGAPCVIALADAPDVESSNAGTPSGLFLRRLEFSESAWDIMTKERTRPAGLYCFWRTTWSGGQRRSMLVDDETLIDIFHRLDSDERPQRVAFRFVLALLLVRKKLLRMVGHTRDKAADGADRELWLVVPRGSEPNTPPIAVVNPRLGEEDVREIANQLGEIMSGTA